jgi:hypothetical protein
MSFPGGNDLQGNSPSQRRPQDKSRGAPHLRLVASSPRPRLVEVRLTAIAGLYPYGGTTRSYQLTERALAQLIEAAERLEAQRA